MPAGRPSDYTPEIADKICELLACGTPLVKICKMDEMPDYSTVRRWEKANDEFRALSARAKADGSHYMADDSLEIADEELPTDPELARVAVQHRKLRIDTRMRLIGKWNAKDYGDKTLLGSDPENPLPAPLGIDPAKLSTDALREIMAARGES